MTEMTTTDDKLQSSKTLTWVIYGLYAASFLIGFTAIVGGAVTLVWRLRSGDDDDDFDDGAVV